MAPLDQTRRPLPLCLAVDSPPSSLSLRIRPRLLLRTWVVLGLRTRGCTMPLAVASPISRLRPNASNSTTQVPPSSFTARHAPAPSSPVLSHSSTTSSSLRGRVPWASSTRGFTPTLPRSTTSRAEATRPATPTASQRVPAGTPSLALVAPTTRLWLPRLVYEMQRNEQYTGMHFTYVMVSHVCSECDSPEFKCIYALFPTTDMDRASHKHVWK